MNAAAAVDMTGKVVAITGANAGIGRATAEALARMGAKVLACGRNTAKLDVATAPELESVSGRYFEKCREKAPSRLAQDEALAKKLWARTETLAAR